MASSARPFANGARLAPEGSKTHCVHLPQHGATALRKAQEFEYAQNTTDSQIAQELDLEGIQSQYFCCLHPARVSLEGVIKKIIKLKFCHRI